MMAGFKLDVSLQDSFVNALKDLTASKEDANDIIYGTCLADDSGIFVKMDGSERYIPVESSVEVNTGDRVGVSIDNHHAVITNNFSTPAANTRTTELIKEDINSLQIEIENPAEELNNTRVTIDENGIEMRGGVMDLKAGTNFKMSSGGSMELEAGSTFKMSSGGSMELEAGSTFSIKSGGSIQIDASNEGSDDSHINLGDGNFSASKSGGMTASSGSFEQNLTVGGYNVITAHDFPYPIVFSNDQPTGNGMFWFRPLEPGASRISYTAFTATSRNDTIRYSVHNPIIRSMTPLSTDTFNLLGNYQYDLSVELYSLSDNALNGIALEIKLTKGNKTLILPTTEANYILPRKYSSAIARATLTTNENLCDNTDPITLSIRAINQTTNPHYADWAAFAALYLQANQTITLIVSNLSSVGSLQQCAVYFIP